MSVCRICSNGADNLEHSFREMMFGTREEFTYIECSKCGTIQIKEIPVLSKYYPENYYSFDSTDLAFSQKWISRFTARQAAKYLTNAHSFMGKIAVKNKTWTRDNFPVYLTYEHLDLDLRSRILDVGCGAGRLLNLLNYYGFKNLTGADVFIEQDIKYANGVKIHKRELDDVEGTFDLIMFHHSLEHFVEPRAALKNAHSLLQKRKYCVVRIPVAAYAWEKYGRNWVQLDAPRHINLFTEASFRRMAREIGFDVENVVYDSTAFQFVGSEQYVRDIPLAESFEDSDTFLQNLFGKEQLTEWGEEAEKLNADHRGDQACFYLKKA